MTCPNIGRLFITTVALTLVVLPAAAAPDDPRRPQAISTEEVPVVSSELMARLNQYQNVRAAAFAGWSPGGKGMLIQTRFGATVQLHRVYEPSGRREQVTFFDEPASGRFLPSTTDDTLLVSLASGGTENYQIYLHGAKPSQKRMLTDGRSRNTMGPVLRDGSKMVIHSNRRNGRDVDMFLADCRRPNKAEVLLEVKDEFWTAHDFSHDGSRLSLLRFVSANESYPAIFDLATKRVKLLPIPGNDKAAFGQIMFAKDDKSLYLTCDAHGEFRELARLDLEKMEYHWLTSDIPWDVTDLEVDPKTGRVAFVTNEDGASKLYVLEGDKYRQAPLPLGIISGLEFSPDSSQIGFTLARPDAPPDAYAIKLVSGELVRWTYSEAGGLDASTFVYPKAIRCKTFDGREVPAYYYRPATATKERPAPVLINIHGGPESQSRPYFSGMFQFYLNDLGIAVITPNVRGSSGYGKTYLKLDNGPYREDSVRDLGAILDFIAAQPELDQKRVAVSGASYGGYMVLAALANYPGRIRAGVDMVGIANFITFLETTSAYRQDLRRAEYGDERTPEMRAVFERISPVNNVDKIRAALLVAHGKNDPRVPFAEARQIAEKVREQGRSVWTVYADNEGHGFEKKENRDYFQAVEMMFLEKFLLH